MSDHTVFYTFLICLVNLGLGISFQDQEIIISVEAEHFISQESDDVRKWHLISKSSKEHSEVNHAMTASGEAYLKILPDTRMTHDDTLIAGTNFSNQPGKMGVLHYNVNIKETGRYYVWVRAYSTGTEDNGIHVGLDGQWPESGQRMQWCEGKNEWTWESKQRTLEVHCGEPQLIYLDIDQSGHHVVSFSMREDGFEFDKWIMSKEYVKPLGEGLSETIFDD